MDTRFQEDPIRNARLCIELAPTHCANCGDFHLRSILRRMKMSPTDKIGDDEEFRSMVRLALSRLIMDGSPIRVAIIGSTDTGILATLMTVAQNLGGDALVASLSVTLLDQCATPLEICKAYAKDAGLPLDTVHTDFLKYQCTDRFDLILMHGVLPFFPAQQRLAYMLHIATWLSERGLLISSTHLGTKPYTNADEIRTNTAIANLRSFAASALSLDATTVEVLVNSLQNSRAKLTSELTVFADLTAATAFYQSAGLALSSSWIVHLQPKAATVHHRKYKERCLVMCRKASA